MNLAVWLRIDEINVICWATLKQNLISQQSFKESLQSLNPSLDSSGCELHRGFPWLNFSIKAIDRNILKLSDSISPAYTAERMRTCHLFADISQLIPAQAQTGTENFRVGDALSKFRPGGGRGWHISRVLCLTFPAVESITLQLMTAACCIQKEQLLSPHGGNSMKVPDRWGVGGHKTWSPNQTHLAPGDTNLLFRIELLYKGARARSRTLPGFPASEISCWALLYS